MDMIEKVLNCYFPGDKFPAVSITGSDCFLNCQHCGQHYLKNMLRAETPGKLKEICMDLSKKGANGLLLSGGSDENGSVRFDNFVDVISEIKSKTELQLNIHTGLISDNDIIKKLAASGVDVASFDLVGDTETIREIYGLDRNIKDYENGLKLIYESGIPNVVPHICIGLYHGKLKGELNALDIINKLKNDLDFVPSKIVFIIFIPTKGTVMQDAPVPETDEILKVIRNARSLFPRQELILGCMRPKKDRFQRLIEIECINAGVNGIVLPSRKTIEYVKNKGYRINKNETCCAVNR
jgi:uncharacterized radical SAM superfamily protein